MWRVFVVVALLGAPASVFAAPYFEFAPDYSQPLVVQPGTTVSQDFAPLNDRISVIDVWVSTTGAAGLDITVQNPSGTVIATRTVSLGTVPDTEGGTRKSIVLSSQLSVSGGELYRLNITPTGSAVNLYYSTSVSVEPGSVTDTPSSYQYGAAVVNGVSQGYSFKFALTESSETTNPSLSDVQVTQPAIGQALVSFTSTEPVDVQLSYGSRTIVWTGQYVPCLPGVSRCSVFLRTTPGTTYSYSLSLKDAWGNTTSTQSSFVALGEGPHEIVSPNISATPSQPASTTATPPGTITPTPALVDNGQVPVISNPRIVSLTPTTATFAWTTSEITTTQIAMFIRPELRAVDGMYDTTLELEHYGVVTGLNPSGLYRARLISTDPFSNASLVLIDFQTPSQLLPEVSSAPTVTPEYSVVVSPSNPPTTSPVSSPSPTTSESPSPTTTANAAASPTPSPSVVVYPSTSTEPGVITWEPPSGDVDGYRVDIFDEFGRLITSIMVDANSTSIPLPAGIPSNARIIVYADRGGAFEKVGDPAYITERPPQAVSYTTSIVIIGGGIVLLAGLVSAWVWQRRRQRVDITPETTMGVGGGFQAGR